MMMTASSRRMFEQLRGRIDGHVWTDRKTRRKFSRDQSIYEIIPRAVAFPAHAGDLAEIIRFAALEGLSVTARGGGSGTAGGALGQDIVVCLPPTPSWQEIGELAGGPKEGSIRVGAGLMHSELQARLRRDGYMLPADVTSAGISQIGGNIATRASGPHALRYGSIDQFVEHLEFFTARGELVNTADQTTLPADMRLGFDRLVARIKADPTARQMLEARKHLKTSSGYNLDAVLRETITSRLLARLLVGSNGTLGFITSATLRCISWKPDRALMLLRFDDLIHAAEAVAIGRNLGAAAIELMNRNSVQTVVEKTGPIPGLDADAHLLFVEFDGPECLVKLNSMSNAMDSRRVALSGAPVVASGPNEIAGLWEIRRRILPFLQNPGPGLKAPAIINDIGVSPADLPNFIQDLERVVSRHAEKTLIYGHAGNGNLHVRPLMDITRGNMPDRLKRLADDVYELVFRYGGTVAAEHGTGRLKMRYLRQEWGDRLYGYMRELKSIFDPDGIFNPEVMWGHGEVTDNLRSDILDGEEAVALSRLP